VKLNRGAAHCQAELEETFETLRHHFISPDKSKAQIRRIGELEK
jgi:hypothetical protein